MTQKRMKLRLRTMRLRKSSLRARRVTNSLDVQEYVSDIDKNFEHERVDRSRGDFSIDVLIDVRKISQEIVLQK